jgi:hypothetical protein
MRATTLGILVLPLSLLSCGKPEPVKPAETKPETPACGLALDKLAGKSFVHVQKSADGKTWTEDILARVKFYKEGDKLKAKYNARSRADFYDFTCTINGDTLDCFEDNPKAADFCRTLFANDVVGPDKSCEASKVAELTGVSIEEAQKAKKEVDDELAKFRREKNTHEIDDMRKVFNSPNNQLRGVFHVKVRPDECRLNLADHYLTMNYGKMREMENVVGTAKFQETDKKLVFEHCKDDKNFVALKNPDAFAKPGESQLEWRPGQQITLRYVGNEDQHPEAGCSYSQDTWFQYEPVALGTPVSADGKGRLNWTMTKLISDPGKYIIHMYRYKACGNEEPKRISVSCQALWVK